MVRKKLKIAIVQYRVYSDECGTEFNKQAFVRTFLYMSLMLVAGPLATLLCIAREGYIYAYNVHFVGLQWPYFVLLTVNASFVATGYIRLFIDSTGLFEFYLMTKQLLALIYIHSLCVAYSSKARYQLMRTVTNVYTYLDSD